MVPRDSQQRPQLYEQLTWHSDEELLNSWSKTLFGCKNGHFLPKKGPKRVKNFDVRILNSFFINKQ